MTVRANRSSVKELSPAVVANYVHDDFKNPPRSYEDYTRTYVPELQAHIDYLVSGVGVVSALEVADQIGTGMRDWIRRFGSSSACTDKFNAG